MVEISLAASSSDSGRPASMTFQPAARKRRGTSSVKQVLIVPSTVICGAGNARDQTSSAEGVRRLLAHLVAVVDQDEVVETEMTSDRDSCVPAESVAARGEPAAATHPPGRLPPEGSRRR